MLCDNCYHRSNCEELPDKNGRCANYLKDGDVCFSDELKFNPCGNEVYDYDSMKKVLGPNTQAVTSTQFMPIESGFPLSLSPSPLDHSIPAIPYFSGC